MRNRAPQSYRLEPLDPRRLMSVTLDGSVVRVDGSEAADNFRLEVSTSGTYYSIFQTHADGTWQNWSWRKDKVATFVVKLKGGDDQFNVTGPFDRFLSLYGDAGHDTLSGTGSSDQIFGGSGNDSINAGGGADFVQGGADADTILGGDGHDTLDGQDGNDLLWGATGLDDLRGGTGNDWIDGGLHDDRLRGDAGNDTLLGADGFDTLDGGANNDSLEGGAQNDSLSGGTGDDQLLGNSGRDYLLGGDGSDRLDGGSGNDSAYGGEHNDSVAGSIGDDLVYGNGGSDSLTGGEGRDSVYGGVGNDRLDGGGGDDSTFGDAGNDSLRGGSGNDLLAGGTGHDQLRGNAGNDSLRGDWGDDGLFGGVGLDTLSGGGDEDRFIQTGASSDMKQDLIQDRATTDATITFHNSNGITVKFANQDGQFTYGGNTWSETHIELADDALQVLHLATGNDNLLDRADGETMRFYRVGDQTHASGGTFDGAAWNGESGIYFANSTFSDGNDFVRECVIHEMGHNWDTEYDGTRWRGLSGWVNQSSTPAGAYTHSGGDNDWWHRTTAQFVSSYARSSPNEDFAESFANYFLNRAGWPFSRDGTDISLISNKLVFMNDLVAAKSV